MRRCAFLTLTDPSDFVIDDEVAYPALRDLGWDVEAVPWNRAGVRWSDYDAVIVRSTWDYQDSVDAFLAVLGTIEASSAAIENDVELMRWNIDKRYLRDLSDRGVSIVPTVWQDRLESGDVERLFDELDASEIVIKPVVGANADGAFRLARPVADARAVEAHYANVALQAQPFVPAVIDEGEFSLFYFDGEHSHTILKTPARGDFRVQEEHGGIITAVVADQALRRAADGAMAALDVVPLYARADFVRSDDPGVFWLMELELIEPALYFRMDARAPRRFAEAMDRRVRARVA